MIKEVKNEEEIKNFGKSIGLLLRGGELIELIGDVGAGKTTLTKGIASGLGVIENVQSPSYTISRTYKGRDNIRLVHYDFYRLNEAGILANEIIEYINDDSSVIVIEWAGVVEGILPKDRLSVLITAPTENSRKMMLKHGGDKSQSLIKRLKP